MFLAWLLYDFELGTEAQAAEARTPPSSDHMSPCEFLTGPVQSPVPQQISYFDIGLQLQNVDDRCKCIDLSFSSPLQ